MSAVHSIRRFLHALALTAAGLLSDAVSSDAEAREPRDESEVAEPDGGGRVASSPSLQHSTAARQVLDLARLESLVDHLGETEPALAAVLLGTALCAARPLERMPIVCEWATSPAIGRRRALARALAHPFMCPGLATAIEALARDEDAHVRTAAIHAALLRVGHDPARYGAVLDSVERRSGHG